MKPVSLVVGLNKSNFSVGEHVNIFVHVNRNAVPVPNEIVRIAVFRPTGEKVFSESVHTDKRGQAMAVYHLKKSAPGSYFIEAHNSDGSMGLTSFLVM